jgi:hypothetical protein
MISSQLGRTVLSGSPMPPDRQQAAPDEDGSYGELVELIDRAAQTDDEAGDESG